MKHHYIAIEGNIGAGKTTLAAKLSEHYGAHLVTERFADNPFLPKFYTEPDKYAFPLELSFLAERYQQLIKETANYHLFHPCVVSDYFFSKSLVFARNNLREDEFELFSRLFHIINPLLPKPDIILYLHLSVKQIQNNIHKRGREYEQKISDDYLQRIEDGYLNMLRNLVNQRVVILEINNPDFVNDDREYGKVIEKLENGL